MGRLKTRLSPPFGWLRPFDGNHQGMGIIVMNYFGNDLFQALNTNTGEFCKQRWLLAVLTAKITKEWTFMYPDLADISFSKAYRKEWNQVQKLFQGRWSPIAELLYTAGF